MERLIFCRRRCKFGEVVRDVDRNNIKDLALDLFNLRAGFALVRINLFFFPFLDNIPGLLGGSLAKIFSDRLLRFINGVQRSQGVISATSRVPSFCSLEMYSDFR